MKALWKNRPLLLSGIGSLALVGFFLLRIQPVSQLSYGRSIVNALRSGDSHSLATFVGDQELLEFEIDRLAAERFFKLYALPALSSKLDFRNCRETVGKSDVVIEALPVNGSSLIQGISIHVIEGSRGPEADGLIQTFLYAYSQSKYWNPNVNSITNKFLTMYRQAVEDGPTLEKIGLRGFYSRSSKKLETWEYRAQSAKARLERLAQNRPPE